MVIWDSVTSGNSGVPPALIQFWEPVGDTFEAPICDATVHFSVLIVSCQSLVPVKTLFSQVCTAAQRQKQLVERWFRELCTPVTQTEHSIQASQFYLPAIISMNQPLNESGKTEILVACCIILCSILVSLLGIHIITS